MVSLPSFNQALRQSRRQSRLRPDEEAPLLAEAAEVDSDWTPPPERAWILFIVSLFFAGSVFMVLSIKQGFNLVFFFCAAAIFMLLAILGKMRSV